MSTCDRCDAEMVSSICSMFNTEQICAECQGIEGAHSGFSLAVRAENSELAKGNTKYEGIGLPDDLREGAEMRKAARQ